MKVLSGDDPRTVASVAERVGIPGSAKTVDARELPDDQMLLASVVEATSVFGRVLPDQKKAIVAALQCGGHVVAMTGDGVNDVPALKQADLGLAMGSGSQATRAVGRIVLLDSSFATVPGILGEGRRVIANIERVANLFVTKTVYAAILAVIVGISAIPFPFYPRHLTIVSTLTIGVPGFFLALSAGAPRAHPGFVRRVLAFTLPAGFVAATVTLITYLVARGPAQATTAQARTGRPDAGDQYHLQLNGGADHQEEVQIGAADVQQIRGVVALPQSLQCRFERGVFEGLLPGFGELGACHDRVSPYAGSGTSQAGS